MKLNDVVVRTLTPPTKGQKTYYDDMLPNFGMRVSQGGTRTFVVRHGTERHLMSLGRYPIISLADARQLARERLAEIVLGKHRPKSVRWDEAVTEYLAECQKKNRPRTLVEYQRHLKVHFNFGATRLGEVAYTDILRKLNKLEATPSERSHALTAVKVFFNWAKKPPRRYILSNPCEGLSPRKGSPRTRVLTDAELQLIWRACEQTGWESGLEPSKVTHAGDLRGERVSVLRSLEGTPDSKSLSDVHALSPRLSVNFSTIVKLLMLTGQRRGEIGALQKSFYSDNQQTICLPATLTKNGREHTFPIGSISQSILMNSLPKDTTQFLFPARGSNSSPKPFTGWAKAKKHLDKLSGVTGWTLHDLRRTFRTNLSKLGVAPHISERLLNHISKRDPMEDVYDLHTFLPEMRAAMDLWEAHLQKLFAG